MGRQVKWELGLSVGCYVLCGLQASLLGSVPACIDPCSTDGHDNLINNFMSILSTTGTGSVTGTQPCL